MNIQSSLQKDIRSLKTTPGAYEWWYFDAISNDGNTGVVVIFYEGNPFSRRYIKRQQQENEARAADFPAISISIYQGGETVYYSFTEIKEKEAVFGQDRPLVQIGRHKMAGEQRDSIIKYTINLDEQLPSGDGIEAELLFESPVVDIRHNQQAGESILNHRWNVSQPRAQVSGTIRRKTKNKNSQTLFNGQGYHDHNIGPEPLKGQFKDWLWGRFHFPGVTFIYYIKNNKVNSSACAWLISNDGKVLGSFDDVNMNDRSCSIFGLQCARKLTFVNTKARLLVQQNDLLDNGPFYQRFRSEAFLNIPGRGLVESSRGITEYLCPPRIYNRLYWPLTNMRIRYKKESPHWVQCSRKLYRWTW